MKNLFTIKFRGKRLDNGEWVYGYLYVGQNDYYIFENIASGFQSHKVIPETVGQFINDYDVHKKEIYVGDVVDWEALEVLPGVWQYGGRFIVEDIRYLEILMHADRIEIVGNVHDFPGFVEPKKSSTVEEFL